MPLQGSYRFGNKAWQAGLQGLVPGYKDTPGPGGDRTYSEIDPYLLQEIVQEGNQRGYTPEFSSSLFGTETTFGSPKAGQGYGPWNPLSMKWVSEEEAEEAANRSTEAEQLAEMISEYKSQGMRPETADALQEIMFKRQVIPKAAIRAAFDVLDQKRQWLEEQGKPITPENLAWAYQGTGTPNKYEIPGGIAYGKPVARNTPRGVQSQVVRRILNNLMSTDSPLGNYIRGIK